jgi:flagellar protein FlgJ
MAAARMYEQQFLKEMVTAMRKSVAKSDLVPESRGDKIFTDQLYDQYVEQWSNVGGVGLSDIIYDQILQKFGPQQRIERPKGPIPTDQHKTFQIQNKSPAGALMLKVAPERNSQNTEILMPWAGELKGVQNLESGEKAAFIQHNNGLQSTFLFQGKLTPNKKDFGPGEPFAQLDSQKNYLWKVEKV